MANGSSLYAAQPHSNPLHSLARLSTPKRSGFRLVTLKSHGSSRFGRRALSALQKYKVKWLDLFLVTLANSFLGERVGNKNSNSNFSKKIYENSPSNHQTPCVYTCSHPGCGSPCPSRGSITISGGIAASCCSANRSPSASNSKILQSGRF
jgi:hypothetical protein